MSTQLDTVRQLAEEAYEQNRAERTKKETALKVERENNLLDKKRDFASKIEHLFMEWFDMEITVSLEDISMLPDEYTSGGVTYEHLVWHITPYMDIWISKLNGELLGTCPQANGHSGSWVELHNRSDLGLMFRVEQEAAENNRRWWYAD